MKNDNTHQCPEGIKILLVYVPGISVAKGRESRTRRIYTDFVPGDVITVFVDEDVQVKLSVNCFGHVSTVLPLDK